MITVAYLANEFPSPVEPYVAEEIEELRRRGIRVIAGSVRKTAPNEALGAMGAPEIILWPPQAIILLRALWLCLRRWERIWGLVARIVFHGSEGIRQRMKALAHTWLGACYAIRLEGSNLEHIHVHHGYLGAWIAMVAARLLDVEFSMTLHGSDLLLHATYLDVKLQNCTFCFTVSDYNRTFILERYPKVAEKVIVARLGVEVPQTITDPVRKPKKNDALTLLAVGRLHAVKDHAFLVRACAQLQARGFSFDCLIAGDGPEWRNLESLIRAYHLEDQVELLGHVAHQHMNSWYDRADVVVLTSRSEGIPLVLMEAMARRKIVLAPAITGIPELVIPGKTGFLYEAGSMTDFVDRFLFIRSLIEAPYDPHVHPYILSASSQLEQLRRAARTHVQENFNRNKRLQSFGNLFLQQIGSRAESIPYEDFVLQQI
jgi:glycosyltransferase involved in cell wall biosynthesis